MKNRILQVNNLSMLFFCFSSISIAGIPFLDQNNSLTMAAYVLAGVFWSGLLTGIGLQILAAKMVKKFEGRKERKYKERRVLIPVLFLAVLFLVIVCFWKRNVFLLSIDLALLLFSIELYFCLKRRYSV